MFLSFCIFIVFCAYTSSHPRLIEKDHLSVDFPVCSRDCWGAVPSKDTRPLNKPVPYVIIHHTAIPTVCNTTTRCMRDMRSMQKYHNSLGWGDIGYHFCVGGDGVAYEGRGWNVIGIHAGPANKLSIGICLIGDWRVETPSAEQLATTKKLLSTGVEMGAISSDYKLIGHNQAMTTECPGGALLEEVSTWDNYHPGHVNFRELNKQTKF